MKYIIQVFVSVIALLLGVIWKLKHPADIEHTCTTCKHCAMVEKGADGKLIFTCGREKGRIYYDWSLPVYCGKWRSMKEQGELSEPEPVKSPVWIRPEDEMPEDERIVLVCAFSKNELVLELAMRTSENGRKHWVSPGGMWICDQVQYWMPLPELPKGGTENA